MAVYVDPLIDYGWKLGPSCHMTADTMEELYSFAEKIGLKRNWIDLKTPTLPHFDLVKNKRDLAVKKGAIEIIGWENIAEHNERLMKIFNDKK